jgi:hypothetical protein
MMRVFILHYLALSHTHERISYHPTHTPTHVMHHSCFPSEPSRHICYYICTYASCTVCVCCTRACRRPKVCMCLCSEQITEYVHAISDQRRRGCVKIFFLCSDVFFLFFWAARAVVVFRYRGLGSASSLVVRVAQRSTLCCWSVGRSVGSACVRACALAFFADFTSRFLLVGFRCHGRDQGFMCFGINCRIT